MKKKKKIKSFTVDGDRYDYLVKLFKETDMPISLSFIVDDYLKSLYEKVTLYLEYYDSQGIEYDKNFIVSVIIRHSIVSGLCWEAINTMPDVKKNVTEKIEKEALIMLEVSKFEVETGFKKYILTDANIKELGKISRKTLKENKS